MSLSSTKVKRARRTTRSKGGANTANEALAAATAAEDATVTEAATVAEDAEHIAAPFSVHFRKSPASGYIKQKGGPKPEYVVGMSEISHGEEFKQPLTFLYEMMQRGEVTTRARAKEYQTASFKDPSRDPAGLDADIE